MVELFRVKTHDEMTHDFGFESDSFRLWYDLKTQIPFTSFMKPTHGLHIPNTQDAMRVWLGLKSHVFFDFFIYPRSFITPMKDLNTLMTLSDKASWQHDYAKDYQKHFKFLEHLPITIFELGIGGENVELGGYSLLGWKDYFENGKIYGLDIYDKSALDSDRLKTFKGSQTDRVLLNSIIHEIGNPDIIIDDASHVSKNTIKSFEILFPQLKPGGYYCIEDLSCSYRHDFNEPGEMSIMDYLNLAVKSRCRPELGKSEYVCPEIFKEIQEIHFYGELCVIRKREASVQS
jgi:hypothetical protein